MAITDVQKLEQVAETLENQKFHSTIRDNGNTSFIEVINKGKTTVENAFVQAYKQIKHAIKALLDYKWIPGE
ncbi:hypothetical protein [Bacillus arachidis]|uniref:hypothetical protein n=1 Tax=Bacillus arachidis TaxID=2819290 RepID=UPI00255C51B1|nr:hypothetical protein [Bacillus arachidis]WIY63182.1 hypothetical protein QRY57_12305 [Bacillus arachidis]